VYKEIKKGFGAKSYMRKGFLIYEKMCEYLVMYEDLGSQKSFMTLHLITSKCPTFFNSVPPVRVVGEVPLLRRRKFKRN